MLRTLIMGGFALLFSACSCEMPGEHAASNSPSVTVSYETADEDFYEPDGSENARIAAGKGAVYFQSIGSNGGLFLSGTMRLWFIGGTLGTPPTAQQQGDEVADGNPNLTFAWPSNYRSSVKRTLKAGWWVIADAEENYVTSVWVADQSEGAFIFNQSSMQQGYSGYFPLAKVKASMWNKGGEKPGLANLTLTNASSQAMPIQLTATRSAGVSKYSTWLMPPGSYQFTYTATNMTGNGTYPARTVPITIATGKVYPHVKMAFKP